MLFTPVFLLPAIGVAASGFYLGNMYLKAQMSAKREKRQVMFHYSKHLGVVINAILAVLSNARSPLLAHFSAAMSGLGGQFTRV